MERYLGENTPKLGFGLMRLPKLADKSIDIEQGKVMVDRFMEAGFTYFDTAYVYTGSEAATKEILVDRYPRESYTLATKINAGEWCGATDAEKCKAEFEESLKRTGAGYFDYYLLHALGAKNKERYDAFGIWDFVKEKKEQGLVKHWGFSFHDTPAVLDQLLTEHPDAEFVQLQLNYADWEDPENRSRECYEVARKHGKSVVVMEPVKGGTLAKPPRAVAELLKAANPEASPASWAIRYVASLDGILTVLSGMSTTAQMEDNISFMKDFRPLDEEEQKTIAAAQKALAEVDQIKCTACRYCADGCPMEINIPGIFAAMNRYKIWEDEAGARQEYEQATKDKGKASDCIQCGQCEAACPQGLPIIERLQECAAFFE